MKQRTPNRLAGATSPYLLQHKDNPVDWYPWGDEALARAKAEERPIFLSIGYSACHWCHVMEEESFEDEATADLMNRNFVCIKVDREERPDLDDLYMTAVQMMTGSGGWPMSVWLTPDLEPFFGGTYFPKDNRYGRPSFQQVLTAVAEAWKSDRASVKAQAKQVRDAIVRHLSESPGKNLGQVSVDPIAAAIADLSDRFDAVHGGFSTAPKFPPHRGLVLLLARWRRTGDENLRRMATLTLDRMAQGGMHDQIGGGFHRYATDAAWQVPHFEKMLYDNALLADAYLEALGATGVEEYGRIASEIFAWTRREMTDAGGALWSSLDADSEGEEGKYYVWTPDQVIAEMGSDEGGLVNAYYGITPSGNFERGASIPHVDRPDAEFATQRGIPPPALRERIDNARERLRQARDRRVRPHLDDKILTSWNGLMIAAMARGSRDLKQPGLLEAARRAAAFLLSKARGPDGLMRVSYRQGRLSPDAFLDDQAYFMAGLLALAEGDRGGRWLDDAVALARATEKAFGDPAGGYFFTPPGKSDLLVRARHATDGATPSGVSVMAANLLAVARLTGDDAFRRRAEAIFSAYQGAMASMPGAFHNMILALQTAGSVEAGVAVSASPPSGPVAPGGSFAAVIRIRIPEGWHIQSSAPSLPDLIATKVTLEDGPVTLVKTDYPAGTRKRLGFAGQEVSVYQGTIELPLTLSLDRRATAGPLAARGEVRYQACDDRACLPPVKVPFQVMLTVSGG